MTGSVDLLGLMRNAHGHGEDVKDVVALVIAGTAGNDWRVMDEHVRGHWRAAAAEIVEFVQRPAVPTARS